MLAGKTSQADISHMKQIYWADVVVVRTNIYI